MSYILLAVFLMAFVTYIPRVIPLVLVNRKMESKFIDSFLYYLPYSVLGAMTFPSVLFSTGNLYFSKYISLSRLIGESMFGRLLKPPLSHLYKAILLHRKILPRSLILKKPNKQ